MYDRFRALSCGAMSGSRLPNVSWIGTGPSSMSAGFPCSSRERSSKSSMIPSRCRWLRSMRPRAMRCSSVMAPWFNEINTFLYGGLTQHGELVGNVCADLNGMGGGARAYRDGEASMAPFFAAMADIGEQELIEDEVPLMQLVSKKIKRDNQAFGKFRGGMGYEMAVSHRGSQLWGYATVSHGSKFPSVMGVMGGYGCCTRIRLGDGCSDDPFAASHSTASVDGINGVATMSQAPRMQQASCRTRTSRRLRRYLFTHPAL